MTATAYPATHRAAARVPFREPRGIVGRLLAWYCRRAYGDVPEPALILLHHPRVLRATVLYEKRIEKFDRLDRTLKTLAELASAAVIGCSWCLDFGYFLAQTQGLALDKLAEVQRWRESDAFTPLERMVLEYAEAMTATPPTVTDEMVAALTAELGVPAVVELTKMIAIENERSRFNRALGLRSQGFSDRCRLPV